MIPIKEIDLPIVNPDKWRYIDYTQVDKRNAEVIGEYQAFEDIFIDHEYYDENSRTEGILIRWDVFGLIPDPNMICLER